MTSAVETDNLSKANLKMQQKMHKMSWGIIILTVVAAIPIMDKILKVLP